MTHIFLIFLLLVPLSLESAFPQTGLFNPLLTPWLPCWGKMSVSKSVLLGDFPCAKNWGKQTNLKQSNTFSTVVVFIVTLLQRLFNKGYWPKLKIIFNSTEFLKWYPWWWVWSPCSRCAHCSEFPGHLAPLLSLALCWHPSHLAPVLLGLFFPRSEILYAEIPLWQRLARCSLTQFPLPRHTGRLYSLPSFMGRLRP